MASTTIEVNQGLNGISSHTQKSFEACFGMVANQMYVIIDDYIKFSRTLNRSASYFYAKALDTKVKGRYQATFEQNSTKDFIRLRNLLRAYVPGIHLGRVTKQMRDRKFETQILDSQLKSLGSNLTSLFNLPSTISTAAKEAVDLFRHANDTLNGIDSVMASVTNIIQKLATATETIVANGSKILTWALKVISFLQLISQKHNQTPLNIASIVTLILPSEHGEYLINILPLAIKGIIDNIRNTRFQAQVMETENNVTVITAFFNMIKDMFALTFTGTQSLTFKEMRLNQDRVKYFISGISSIKIVYNYFVEILRFVLNEIKSLYIDYIGCTGVLDETYVTSIVDKFYQYKSTKKFELARRESAWAKNVKVLHEELLEIQRAITQRLVKDEKFALKTLMPHLRTMISEIEDAMLVIPPYVLSGTESSRNKPYWLYIFGEPRIGKSAFFQPLLVTELVARLRLTQEYQHISNYTYFRRTGSEFWDGYTDQLVTWYNDIFQLNSRPEDVVTTIAELTDIVDDNPCVLNMAACEMKDKVYFTSKIVVSNGQNDLPGQQFLTNNCWSNGQHILARRNCVVEFILNKSYAGARGIDREKLRVAMSDPSVPKITCGTVELIPTDLYTIKFRHEITGYVRAQTDLVTAVNVIVDDMIKYMNSQDSFKSKLFDFFKQRFDDVDESGKVKPLVSLNPLYQPGPGMDPNHMSIVRFDPKVDPESIAKQKERREEALNNRAFRGEMFDFIRGRPTTTTTVVENSPVTLCTCYDRLCDYFMVQGKSPEEREKLSQRFLSPHVCLPRMSLYDEEINIYDLVDPPISEPAPVSTSRRVYERVRNAISSAYEYVKSIIASDRGILTIAITSFVLVEFTAVMYSFIKTKFPSATDFGEDSIFESETSENAPSYSAPRLVRRQNVVAETSENTPTYAKPILKRAAEKVAQTSENTPTYSKPKITRAPRIVGAQAYDDQNIMIENSLRSHFCRLSMFCIRNDRKLVMSQVATIVAVGGNVFMTQKHSYLRYQQLLAAAQEHNCEMNYELHTCTRTTMSFTPKHISWYLPEGDLDIAFLQIKRGTAYKQVSHFFLREGDSVNLTGAYLYGIRTPLINGMMVTDTTILPVSQTTIEDVEYDTGESICILDNTVLKNITFTGVQNYVYQNNHTLKGDCGMLLMASDSKLNTRRILGMHIAGSPSTNEGVAVPVFAEDIDDAIAYFNRNDRVIVSQQCEMTELCQPEGKVADLIRDAGQIPIGKLKSISVDGVAIQPRIMLPRQTNIQPSVASGLMTEKYGPTTLKPAHLKPFTDSNGIKVQPLSVALSKYETHPKFIPEDSFKKIKYHIVDSYNSARTYPIKNRRVLTDMEAVNGFGSMKQIDMSTSSGYPYCKRSNNGKNHWFYRELQPNGSSLFTMKQYLSDQVEDRILKASKGIIKETYFVDTLKDETRPIEKVEQGKTRVFQIGPLDLTVTMRKYFGSFIDFIHSSFLTNEMAIGVNPNSVEWGIKRKRLTRFGNKGWDGDFANYDASIWCQIVDMCAEIINGWYEADETDSLIRHVLMRTLVFSYHILDDIVFLLFGGNPSGNVLTTILNGMVFQILIRLFYIENIDKNLTNYDKNLAVWNYGDDNMVLFRHGLKYTMEDARKFFARYGMTYTPADKSAIEDVMIDFDDMTFLKRKWVMVEGEIMAPIERQVILEIPRWSEGDITNMDNQLQRYNAALLEISNYGRREFYSMRSEFTRQIQILNELGYAISCKKLFSYEHCYNIKRESSLSVDELDLAGDTAPAGHASAFGESDQLKRSSHDTGFDTPNDHYSAVANTSILRNFSAQMAETNKDQAAEAMVTVEKSTIIYDSAQELATVDFRPGFPTHMIYPKPSLDYLIGRPFLWRTLQWNTNMTVGYSLTNNNGMNFPWCVQEISEIQQLLKFHNYYRPTCRVLIKVNGTAMHFGKIVAYYGWPDPAMQFTSRPMSDEAYLKSCYNYSWSQMSANSTQITTMNVPYLGPFDMVPTRAFDQADIPWRLLNAYSSGYLDIRVALPLQVISNASASIDVAVFLIIDDLGRVGIAPGATQAARSGKATSTTTAQRKMRAQIFESFISDTPAPERAMPARARENETVQSAKDKVLPSRIASDLARWFGALTKIPFLGTVAEIGKETSNLSATILRALGYSIPVNVETPYPVVVSSDRIIQYDTVANAIALAPEPAPFVSKDITVIGSEFSDYDITAYCAHPMFLESFKISSDQTIGEILFGLPIRPFSMCTYEELGIEPNTMKVMIPTRLAYMQRFFDFWRGSMRFHLSIAASRFHSGRIRITWIPTWDNNFDDVTDRYDDNYLAAYPSILLDIAGDTDVSFTIPYFQPQNWLNTGYPFDTEDKYIPSKLDTNGLLLITVVNSLVLADATATAGVLAQLFVGGGPDLQFAFPNLDQNGKMGFPTRNPVAVPAKRSFTAEMGDLSSDMLRTTEARPIYEINSGFKEAHITQSTNVTSLKQLMSMGGPVFLWTAPTNGVYQFNMRFNWNSATICQIPPSIIPADPSVEDYIYHASINNYAFNIAPLRALTRGAYRVQFIANTSPSETVVTYTAVSGTASEDYSPDGCVHVELMNPQDKLQMHDLYSSQGCHWYKTYTDSNITVDVPYYGVTKAVPTYYTIRNEETVDNPFVTGVLSITRWFQQGSRVLINVGYGDDAQLGYDLPLPYVSERIDHKP